MGTRRREEPHAQEGHAGRAGRVRRQSAGPAADPAGEGLRPEPAGPAEDRRAAGSGGTEASRRLIGQLGPRRTSGRTVPDVPAPLTPDPATPNPAVPDPATPNPAAAQRTADLLWDSDEVSRLLVEGISDYAIFMLDLEGRIASWNLGAQRIKGYAAD